MALNEAGVITGALLLKAISSGRRREVGVIIYLLIVLTSHYSHTSNLWEGLCKNLLSVAGLISIKFTAISKRELRFQVRSHRVAVHLADSGISIVPSRDCNKMQKKWRLQIGNKGCLSPWQRTTVLVNIRVSDILSWMRPGGIFWSSHQPYLLTLLQPARFTRAVLENQNGVNSRHEFSVTTSQLSQQMCLFCINQKPPLSNGKKCFFENIGVSSPFSDATLQNANKKKEISKPSK